MFEIVCHIGSVCLFYFLKEYQKFTNPKNWKYQIDINRVYTNEKRGWALQQKSL